MFAEAMCETSYHQYRVRMEALLHIPLEASAEHIHEQIENGFPASAVKMLVELGAISPITRDCIVPLRTLKRRLANHQQLTPIESHRLFQVVHIIALAEALFGNPSKARRWLSKPKECLSGKQPVDLLFTTPGARHVEQMLVRIAEGFAF